MKRTRVRPWDVAPWIGDGLGSVDSASLVDAWRQAHHIAQAVAEVGKSWGQPRDDDAHSALMSDGSGTWASSSRAREVRACLSLAARCVRLVHAPGDSLAIREEAWAHFDGWTLGELRAWVRAHAERWLGAQRQEAVPAPDLPEHPVASGRAIDAIDGEAFEALEDHYAAAGSALDRFARAAAGLADDGGHELTPRLWPHHFDAASLLVVERDTEGAMTKTIGVGLAPPDEHAGSGYWYVSPWARDGFGDRGGAPALPIGRWGKAPGASMALLPLEEWWTIGSDADEMDQRGAQSGALGAFVASAVDACLDALGAGGA